MNNYQPGMPCRHILLLLCTFFTLYSAVVAQSIDLDPIAEAWICDENLQAIANSTSPLTLGSEIRICVQPTALTRNRRVVMRSIDRFVFSKGDRGRNGVQEVITNKQAVFPEETKIACQPGSIVCSFQTRLFDDFFFPVKIDETHYLPPSRTVIQGNGIVSMEFIAGSGTRHLLRGTINLHPSRRVQASAGPIAGTDDIQILNIVIAEEKRWKDRDDAQSVSEVWKALPRWAQAMFCVGVMVFVVCCCCCLGLFGWIASVQFSKSTKQNSNKVDAPSHRHSTADSSGRTMVVPIDDDGCPTLHPDQNLCPTGNPRRTHSQTLDSQPLDSTKGPIQVRKAPRQSSDILDPHARARNTLSGGSQHRPYRSPSLMSSTSDHGSIREPVQGKRVPTRHSTDDSLFVPKDASSLSGGSHHPPRRISTTPSPIRSRSRHASLGPSIHTQNGLDGSRHSHVPPTTTARAGFNNSELLRGSNHSRRGTRPSVNSNSSHGPPRRCPPIRRAERRHSFVSDSTTSLARSSQSHLPRRSCHGPARTRLTMPSEPPRQASLHSPGQDDEQSVSSSMVDDDDVCSFASSSATPPPAKEEERDLETTPPSNKKKIYKNEKKGMKKAEFSAVSQPDPSTSPLSKSKGDLIPLVPMRAVSSMNLVEPVESLASAGKSKKKKMKKKVEPPVPEEVKEEAWGDQLD